MNDSSKIISLIQSTVNKNVHSISPLIGGSIASAYHVTVDNNQSFFVKVSPQHSEMFLKEANGLRELKKSNTIRVPEIIAVSNDVLILEFLNVSSPTNRKYFFEQFGR